MKLYTSEDLIKAIAFGFGICHKEGRAPFNKEMIEFIASLEPTKNIELPSDEEILKNGIKPLHGLMDEWDKGFLFGAKLMHFLIQGGNK